MSTINFIDLFDSDIDECATTTHGCEICANLKGSYVCSCNPGFHLKPDNKRCTGMIKYLTRCRQCLSLKLNMADE